MSYIEVNQISKTFKVAKKKSGLKEAFKSFFKREYINVEAIKDASFKIDKGEIVAYIGPNGAGKSTTIKILSGILVPDGGKCTIDGITPWKDRKNFVKKIGVVFGQRSQLWWDIPAEDTFDLLKDIYDIEEEKYQENKKNLIEKLNLKDIINIPVRQLSLGQRMRCEIAASLLHDPEILFLDEPTIGLDAISKQLVRDFIKQLNKEKHTTIILTSHDMSDITYLAKRIILIGKGQVLYDGSIQKLKNKYITEKAINIKTNDKLITHKKGILQTQKIDNGYQIIINSKELTITDFINYITDKIIINDINILEDSIDNLIIKLYKDYNI